METRDGQADAAVGRSALTGIAEARVLAQDHRRLEKLFDVLLARAVRGDQALLRARWDLFERWLREHMAAEEEHLLDGFAQEHPEAAAALRKEHDEIRALVTRLAATLMDGLDITAVRELAARMRLHAAEEERTLYAWSSRHLPPSRWDDLSRQLGWIV